METRRKGPRIGTYKELGCRKPSYGRTLKKKIEAKSRDLEGGSGLLLEVSLPEEGFKSGQLQAPRIPDGKLLGRVVECKHSERKPSLQANLLPTTNSHKKITKQ